MSNLRPESQELIGLAIITTVVIVGIILLIKGVV